jgi:hypothetical protein
VQIARLELEVLWRFPAKFNDRTLALDMLNAFHNFRRMLNTMAKQNLKLAVEAERPKQTVLQEKNSSYPLKVEGLSTPIPVPIRHQHFIRVQQYYTGDA